MRTITGEERLEKLAQSQEMYRASTRDIRVNGRTVPDIPPCLLIGIKHEVIDGREVEIKVYAAAPEPGGAERQREYGVWWPHVTNNPLLSLDVYDRTKATDDGRYANQTVRQRRDGRRI